MLQREQICETFKSERDAHFGPQRVNPEKSDLAVTANFRECIQKSHSSLVLLVHAEIRKNFESRKFSVENDS